MKYLPIAILMLVMAFLPACNSTDDNWDDYKEWREVNDAWLQQKKDQKDDAGKAYYTKVIPEHDPNAYVLIHYFNDRSKTLGNLSPMITSTVDVKYHGRTYDDVPFDSSYTLTAAYGDSIYRTPLNSSIISGWRVALMDMRVGDTCEVIIPYQQGYGQMGSGPIKPYSNLIFGIKLVDIPGYEKPAK